MSSLFCTRAVSPKGWTHSRVGIAGYTVFYCHPNGRNVGSFVHNPPVIGKLCIVAPQERAEQMRVNELKGSVL